MYNRCLSARVHASSAENDSLIDTSPILSFAILHPTRRQRLCSVGRTHEAADALVRQLDRRVAPRGKLADLADALEELDHGAVEPAVVEDPADAKVV